MQAGTKSALPAAAVIDKLIYIIVSL